MPKDKSNRLQNRTRDFPFDDPAVEALFSSYTADTRACLLQLREMIFAVAKATSAVGRIEETLRWGQPSYLTSESKSGSILRLDAVRNSPGTCALYFHCQTTLISDFRKRFGRKLHYEGNRALLFSVSKPLPETEVRECVRAALTYRLKTQGARTPLGNRIR
ncbi:MAG: DUF1801 domain-containing protein [Nibricoccus sp.]